MAALDTDGQPGAVASGPETISMISFAELNHPRVVEQFTGVTDSLRNGNTFVPVNVEGLGILPEQPAADKELHRE
jgi:hypothetical protein